MAMAASFADPIGKDTSASSERSPDPVLVSARRGADTLEKPFTVSALLPDWEMPT